MKKVLVTLSIVLLFAFLIGCLDYKAYDLPTEELSEDDSLLQEIAQIEKELEAERESALAGTEEAEEVDEEDETEEKDVVLPELGEQEDTVYEDDLEVVEVKENELLSLNPTIVDPDGDPITFTFSKPLNKEGEWQTNYGDAGEYIVTLTATDGVLTTTKKVKVVVERVNVAPSIENVRDITAKEGDVVNFAALVDDVNGDEVTVTVSEPLSDGSFVTDHTSAGEYLITVTADDGEDQTEKSFKLTVEDVNVKPTITLVRKLIVKEGETVTLNPTVTDLDEDEVEVNISEPVGQDGVWETSFTDNGEYTVTVTASDGKDTVTQIVKIVVEDVNMPPEIVGIVVEKN